MASSSTSAWDGVLRTYYPQGIGRADLFDAKRYLFGPPDFEDVFVPKYNILTAEVIAEHVQIFKGPPLIVVYTNKALFEVANIPFASICITMGEKDFALDKIEHVPVSGSGMVRASMKRVKGILGKGSFFRETKNSLVVCGPLKDAIETLTSMSNVSAISGFKRNQVEETYKDVLDKVFKDLGDEHITPETFMDPIVGEVGVLRVCAVCGNPTTNKCARCKKAYVCSEECLKMFWPSHKETCKKV
jgi:hypothetical protein